MPKSFIHNGATKHRQDDFRQHFKKFKAEKDKLSIFNIYCALHNVQHLQNFMKKKGFVLIRKIAYPGMLTEKYFPTCPDK